MQTEFFGRFTIGEIEIDRTHGRVVARAEPIAKHRRQAARAVRRIAGVDKQRHAPFAGEEIVVFDTAGSEITYRGHAIGK